MTLHWHGIDVPNAEDGVAGVTQDAVRSGGTQSTASSPSRSGPTGTTRTRSRTSRCSAGCSASLSSPPGAGSRRPRRSSRPCTSTTAAAPSTAGPATWTVDAADGADRPRARRQHRQRGPLGLGLRLALPGPRGGRLRRATSRRRGRATVLVGHRRRPRGPRGDRARRRRRAGRGGGAALLIAPQERAAAALPQPTERLDLLAYGTPAPLRLRPGAGRPALHLLSVGRRPGFIDGRPGLWWSINGHLFPDVPMFVVDEGDVVRMTIEQPQSATCIPCICTATTPSSWPRRRQGDRQPVVGRLAGRGERRRLRHRVRRRQPGHLDGPLPQPRPRGRGPGGAPRLHGRHRAVPRRRAVAAAPTTSPSSRQAARRGAPGRRRELWWRGFDRPTGRGADRGSGTIGVPDVASTRTAS